MQTNHRFFDDLSRAATGAAGVFGGLRTELENFVKQRLEKLLGDMDLVTREEFETVREMAVAARRENERLHERLEKLEGKKRAGTKTPTRAAAAGKKNAAGKTAGQ